METEGDMNDDEQVTSRSPMPSPSPEHGSNGHREEELTPTPIPSPSPEPVASSFTHPAASKCPSTGKTGHFSLCAGKFDGEVEARRQWWPAVAGVPTDPAPLELELRRTKARLQRILVIQAGAPLSVSMTQLHQWRKMEIMLSF